VSGSVFAVGCVLLCVWCVCVVWCVTVCVLTRVTFTYLSNSSVHTSSKLCTILAICSVSCSAGCKKEV
jgi:hypothetical protein